MRKNFSGISWFLAFMPTRIFELSDFTTSLADVDIPLLLASGTLIGEMSENAPLLFTKV